MTNQDTEAIHTAVRDHYRREAENFSSECCGSKAPCDCSSSKNYVADDLQGLPAGLADVSLGCGNPVSAIDMREGDTVMDLGSGGGLDCFLSAKKVGPTGKVIGVDMTPEMIAKAEANALKVGVPNVEFRQGQIESIPVADAEVDVVISNCVINLSPDKPAVFREMYRALKSGGRVAVFDIVTNGPMSPMVAKSQESWAGCVAGALDMEEYRQGLIAAGFQDVAVTPTDGTPLASVAQRLPGVPFSALITARKP
ncbi:MAG: arsenite methyltransferase [Anaerolineales bacterium]